MLFRLLKHARSNAIAYAALMLSSLGLVGGAYAAFALPANSVGARQLRNHSIGPVKLDPRTIGGSVRHWVQVDARGRIVSSSSHARQAGVAEDGDYVVSWSDTFSSRCVALATPRGTAALLSPAAGIANAVIAGRHPTRCLGKHVQRKRRAQAVGVLAGCDLLRGQAHPLGDDPGPNVPLAPNGGGLLELAAWLVSLELWFDGLLPPLALPLAGRGGAVTLGEKAARDCCNAL